MLHLPKEVAEIKSDKLSHAMVSQLIRVSHYIGLIKGQVRTTPLKRMLFKMMLIAEIRYINALQGSDYSYEEILIHIYSGKEKDTLKQQYLRLLESVEYIRQVTSVYPVFPATDILKINELLSNEADGILQSNDIPINMEMVSAELWELLGPFYDPSNDFPKLVEAILVCYCLDKAFIGINLHPFCKELILNYAMNKSFIIDHYSLFVTKEIIAKGLDCMTAENYVSHILDIIFDSTLAKGDLIIELERAFNCIEADTKSMLPKLYSEKLLKVFRENLVLNNSMVEQELNVSPKTAISYLKQLEEYGFLESIKAGREKLYINSKAFEVMKSCM